VRKVHLYSNLQRYTGNQAIVDIEGNTVGECLDNLIKHFPKLKSALFDKSGKLTSQVFVSINLNSANPEKLSAPLKEADQIYIVIIVAGG
jgi:sulfur-carrier protein